MQNWFDEHVSPEFVQAFMIFALCFDVFVLAFNLINHLFGLGW